MKKTVLALIFATTLFSLAACGNLGKKGTGSSAPEEMQAVNDMVTDTNETVSSETESPETEISEPEFPETEVPVVDAVENVQENTQAAGLTEEPRHAPNMYVNWTSSAGFDAVEVDWYCETDALNTYWAVHNWSNGYAGFQNKDGNHVLLLSLWDLPDGTTPTVEYVSEGNSGVFGGEGTGKQVFTNYDWQVGTWYSMRIQLDREDGKSIYSQWVKEDGGEWTKTAAISYPGTEFLFYGVSVFQEDFCFSNEMRSCRLFNARGRYDETDEWEELTECRITNSFFPTSEATWTDGVMENITFNCDWGIKDGAIWVQSGGQDFTLNGKKLPAVYVKKNAEN